MKPSLEEFVAFVSRTEGVDHRTIGNNASFTAFRTANGVKFIPGSKKARPLIAADIAAYLEIFERTESFNTSDYSGDLRNASYVLGLIREMQEDNAPKAQTPDHQAQKKRAFRSDDSYDAERTTRGMLEPFLRERGFEEVKDVRKRFGQAESQTLVARDPTGTHLAMSVRICWRKDLPGDALGYSAAQLLAGVDKRDWVGTLAAKVEREKKAGSTHFLFVQRAGSDIVHAAMVPIDSIVPIWIAQRDISAEMIKRGELGARKKNHAMNGSSPTIWLRDSTAQKVTDALWNSPGVKDLAKFPLIGTAENVHSKDDSVDDLPGVDYGTLGSDGAPRFSKLTSGVARDPKVREEVRKRNRGACERVGCGDKRSYSGFVDVHHILGAEHGDRYWNCIALCPNCHREAHFAPNREEVNKQLSAFASQWRPQAP